MHTTSATLTLTALSLAVVAPAIAQAPQTAPAAVRPSATSRAVEPPGPPVPLGPYAEVTIDAAEGLPTHTVYRPTDLSAFPAKDKLPIVVWGNGACRMDGLMYRALPHEDRLARLPRRRRRGEGLSRADRRRPLRLAPPAPARRRGRAAAHRSAAAEPART